MKKSIVQIVSICILTIIGLLLSFVSFKIPGTTTIFKSFSGGIKLGTDLSGGVVAVYDCELIDGDEGNLSDRINSTIERISNMLTSKGYTEATVTTQGNSRIRIEVPDVDDPDELFDLIGSPAELIVSGLDTYESAKASSSSIFGQDIKSVSASYQQSSSSSDYEYGVSLEFDSDATDRFKDMTQEAYDNGSKIYIYIDYENSGTVKALGVQSVISDGKTFISGGMNSLAEAQDYALQIESGTYNVKLTTYQNSVVSPTLGVNALKNALIAGAIAMVLIFIFMVARYGCLGLIADLSLSIYVVLMMFFLSVIPLVQLSLAGIAGIILSIGMAVDANVIIFERVKDEYKFGKKLRFSFNDGFKNSISAIVDGNVTTILASIVLLILGTGAIKGFAITLLIGIVLSLFSGLVVTRWLMNIALRINNKKAKAYALKREVVSNEK